MANAVSAAKGAPMAPVLVSDLGGTRMRAALIDATGAFIEKQAVGTPKDKPAGLSGDLGVPVLLANDADLATLGEHRFGAGQGTQDMVYMTCSTGVGAG